MIWSGLIPSIDGLEKRLTSPEGEGFLPADCTGLSLQLLPESPACWPTLQVLDLLASTTTGAHFLRQIPFSMATHTLLVLFFWRALADTLDLNCPLSRLWTQPSKRVVDGACCLLHPARCWRFGLHVPGPGRFSLRGKKQPFSNGFRINLQYYKL